ncbi:MAG: sensor domain-containing diguanylate cyclase [Pseudomonadota bacterium]
MKPDQILASLSQLHHQKRPVTLVAIAFFSLVSLSLAAVQGWSVYQAREAQLLAADMATVDMTRALCERLGHLIGSTDTLLGDLVERIETSDGQADPRLTVILAQRLPRHSALSGLAVYDASGALGASVGSVAAGPHPHALDPAPGLFIGQPLRDATGKQWLLPLSRRITRTDGSYGGMVLASVQLAALQGYASDLELGAHGSLAVALDSGALLLARPPAGQAIGKDVSQHRWFQLWRVPPRSAAGNQVRDGSLFSYRRMDGYALLVTVNRASADVLASWRDSALLSSATATLLLLLQLWMGIRLYGQIALRDRLEKERRILQKLLVKKSRSLRHQALKDALTGIANRRQLDTRLVREFNRAMHEGSSLAMVILDVDFFKKYNDQHGHPAGDECLKAVAGCVNGGRRRRQDLAARMGGEEFAILLPNTGLRGAIAVAEKIRKTVAAQRLTHIDGFPHAVTVSCGVHALIPIEGMTAQELVDAADRALYLAKTSGRNRVRAEGSTPPSRSRRFSLVINK